MPLIFPHVKLGDSRASKGGRSRRVDEVGTDESLVGSNGEDDDDQDVVIFTLLQETDGKNDCNCDGGDGCDGGTLKSGLQCLDRMV